MLTTLIRTHNRPEKLERCLKSLSDCKQEKHQIIIISDDPNDEVESIVENIQWGSGFYWTRFRPDPQTWPPNDYFNQVHHLIKGTYISYIDDDDMVKSKNYFKSIEKEMKNNKPMIIWKANLGRLYTKNKDTILPETHNWKKRPVLSHFSTLNMAVRSDLAKNIKWPAKRGGDGLFAQAFWDKYVKNDLKEVAFIDEVLSGCQISLSTHKSKNKLK